MNFKILEQPYPFNYSDRQHLWFSLGSGLFVFSFLAGFQPFGIANWHSPNKMLILSGYGFITVVCLLLFFFGIRKIFSDYFQEKNWTIGREILANMMIILLISLGNYFYSISVYDTKIYVFEFLMMLFYTVIIGIFPTIIIVLVNYINQLLKYNQPPIITPKTEEDTTNIKITLLAENEKDTVSMLEHDLYFIESSDNYSTIYFWNDQKLQKELIRSSLSRLEGQLSLPHIVRCHRSFIVNLQKVKSISGNAQGYKLHLSALDLQVPVARKYSDLVVGYLKK